MEGGDNNLSTKEVASMVSQAWKALPDDKRVKWEEMERNDKSARFCERGRSRNISLYPSSWKIPATKKWMPIHYMDPKEAPKRPMSAFQSYMKSKRAYFRDKNMDDNNKNDDDDGVEVSNIIIAQMWKDADLEEKQIFLEREFRLRHEYNIVMADWAKQRIQTTAAEEQESERKRRRMRK
ncbi:hypothetical protein FRACYDRAFT_218513 [Fragilariopsis cylindrus CCMP1102]|uniref:HMG box domain-containing protein n=1 Tax=Fragilariopsis cylindrus CCMP1102 TaxID=635003 RepID=A0A1E7F7Y5_9STRA|nr:hypothetical protein FRACYDRAFT_218513 [Fragilariopsis cylindrus CCMP1102]|eukprot:OEU14267.1 hypothetical protein FRACYDRAFT_218513 [Fragilariopsis cylindrus CCMP1102]